MSWTFGGIPFTWLRQSANGVATSATWNRAPILVQRPILGADYPDIARIGYGAWEISGAFVVEATNAAAFQILNGTAGELIDGIGGTYTAVATITMHTMIHESEGTTGEVKFVRIATGGGPT